MSMPVSSRPSAEVSGMSPDQRPEAPAVGEQ